MHSRGRNSVPLAMTRTQTSRLSSIAVAGALLMSSATAAHAAEQTMFTKESTPLFATQKGKILGQLTPGTQVTVLRKAGAKVQVTFDGWTEEYRELEIFAGKELRIERASLVRISDKHRKVLKKDKGRFDVAWTQVKLTGWVNKRQLTKKLDGVWKKAQDIHQERCTECHDFMQASEFTAQQWSGTLRIMTHRAALTPEEEVLVRQYLQSHAREKTSD